MKYLFNYVVVISVSCFSAQSQSVDSLFLTASVTKLQHAKEYTLKVAQLMPESGYLFKPTPGEMSFGEQLLHLSSNMGWLCSSYLSNSKNPVTKTDNEFKKKGEIITVVSKTYEFAMKVLRNFNAANLTDTVPFFAGTMSKLQIINLLNDHQTHHRAQMLVYLRLNGIKPPDYAGW